VDRVKRRNARRLGLIAAVLAVTAVACGDVTTGSTATTASTAKPGAPPPAPPSTRLLASDGKAGDYMGGALWYNTFAKPIAPVYYATAG
jgi:hypothetical protein